MRKRVLRMKRAVFTLCMTVCLGLFAGKHLGAQQVQTLDEVISQAARAVEAKLSQGSKLAILNFLSTAEVFFDYVIEELPGALVVNGKVTVIKHRSLDLIRKEMQLQLFEKGESYDYGKDFKVLTPIEKGEILKTAKILLKVQKKTALIADAPAPPMEAKKTGLA